MVEDIARRFRSGLRFLQNNYESAFTIISRVKRSLPTTPVSVKKYSRGSNKKKKNVSNEIYRATQRYTSRIDIVYVDKWLIELFPNE